LISEDFGIGSKIIELQHGSGFPAGVGAELYGSFLFSVSWRFSAFIGGFQHFFVLSKHVDLRFHLPVKGEGADGY